ncbi:MAG TPA: hypothetical protein VF950_14020 [Planctomycetota bacterium]
MKLRWAPLLLLLAVSCRKPIRVDTSASKLIPRDVAMDKLKAAMATSDAAAYTTPKRSLEKDAIKEWHVDDLGFEARAEGQPPIRVEFKDVTETRLERVALYYQIRIFTAAQTNSKKDFAHFNWAAEEPARRALELIDALWRKD